MKIIIVGDGMVGDTLIRYISGEGHHVTVIDPVPARINRVVNQYDVQGVVGNGAGHDVLQEAGVSDTDLLIAVTGSDELNMVCCMLAEKLGASRSIARVRNPEYFRERGFVRDYMGIDFVVNPEYEAANEITRLVRFPAALKMEAFAKGRVDMAEIHVDSGHPLIGQKLATLQQTYGVSVLVCAVLRGEDVFIPGGDFVLCEGDIISITASHRELSRFFGRLGLMDKPVRDVMIMGGGRCAFYLAEQLLSLGMGVRIVESDEVRARELSELLPQAAIILGDCSDSELLEEEGIAKADACIALTENDEKNSIVSLYARSHGVERVIARIDSDSLVKTMAGLGVDCIISPRRVCTTGVLRYLRGLENSKKIQSKLRRAGKSAELSGSVGDGDRTFGIVSLYKLCNDRAEAVEFNVDETFRALGVPLMSPDFKLKKNTLIAQVVRRNTVIQPHGSTTLEVGDSVIIVTTSGELTELNDILE
ncbi:MAG: Trk system potassium transporter TrkA [Clostridia bacterium]|nr:Trk system potassium transporter TrkA [Clostridia bacterium]